MCDVHKGWGKNVVGVTILPKAFQRPRRFEYVAFTCSMIVARVMFIFAVRCVYIRNTVSIDAVKDLYLNNCNETNSCA